MNVLVIAPHPDDDIIGCGGSIILHRKKGDMVSIVYITSGESGDSNVPKNELMAIREKEAGLAAKSMGVSDVTFLHKQDGWIAFSPSVVQQMTEIIRSKNPNIVYIPHKDDGHRDHRASYDICMEALYRAEAQAFQEYSGKPWTVETILAYEVWTPLSTYSFTKNISDVLEQKVDALKKHSSQIKNVAYDEAVRGLNRYRGAMSGKGIYCECFQVIRTE